MSSRFLVNVSAAAVLVGLAALATAQRQSPPKVDLMVTAFQVQFQEGKHPGGPVAAAEEAAAAASGAQLLWPGAQYELRCTYSYGETAPDALEQIPPWKIRFTFDGEEIATREASIPKPQNPPAAAPGMRGSWFHPPLVATANWSAPSSASQFGKHTLSCVLDPTQKIVESDEGNNQAARTVLLKGHAIQGSLIVVPNSPVDPGVTELRLDADITAMQPAGVEWWLDASAVELSLVAPPRKVSATGHVTDLIGHPFRVPCSAAASKNACFRLTAKAGAVTADLGTVCVPVASPPGPAEPELVVHHPVQMGPGSVFRFSAKVPRKLCDASFRVSQSPVESAGWATAWRNAQLSAPTVEFPETFSYSGSGGSSPAGMRSKSPPCFVLVLGSGTGTAVDKWCYTDPAVASGGSGNLALPTPAKPSSAQAGSNDSGSRRLALPPSSRGSQVRKPDPGAPAPAAPQTAWMKPDLVVQYQPGGGWASVPGTLVVRNLGKTAAGPSQLRLTKPGAAPTLVPVPPIAAGSYTEIALTNEMRLYAAGGTVTVDALGQVDEANEKNNDYMWTASRK